MRIGAKFWRYNLIERLTSTFYWEKDKPLANEMLKAFDLEELCADELDFIIDGESRLTFQEYLVEHYNELCELYTESNELYADYLLSVFGDAKKIAFVDAFGKGSSAIAASQFMKDYVQDVQLYSYLAGIFPIANIPGKYQDKARAYLFDFENNLSYFTHYRQNVQHSNIVVELLLSSDSPTFKYFSKDDHGQIQIQFEKITAEDYPIIRDIHKGVLDFAREYMSKSPSLQNLFISTDDVATLLFSMIDCPKYFSTHFAELSTVGRIGFGTKYSIAQVMGK
jgi:hypothetical protein